MKKIDYPNKHMDEKPIPRKKKQTLLICTWAILGLFFLGSDKSVSPNWTLLGLRSNPVLLGTQEEHCSSTPKLHFRRSCQGAEKGTQAEGKVSEGILSTSELDTCESKIGTRNITASRGMLGLRHLSLPWGVSKRPLHKANTLPFSPLLQLQPLRVRTANRARAVPLTAMGPWWDYLVPLCLSFFISKMGVIIASISEGCFKN